ncbi:MAG TPA: bifunctional methylenetetrahydrofolate dehydrogenase/methenyltetrahydrofolate cyclohydrolase FolD [Alphaproteobacteria bacterium]|nr:bifunctional methylenetetrahydrofolate dehydrogenase/methenyltetrahydrofolate cyclohydrolase FolD [Alphaproteobacteria bacterium]
MHDAVARDDHKVINGKAFAARILADCARTVAEIKERKGARPGLAVVLVGEDPASQVYVRNKSRETEAAGMTSFKHVLPASTAQSELLSLVNRLNTDPNVDGILVQLPLPAHIDAQAVIDAIDPAKDVDGFHYVNAGKLAVGREALVPCTPMGCMHLIRDRLENLAGLHAVVLGRSNIVGKPVAQLLLQADCTVTMAHSKTRDLPALCRTADILVAAVGRPEMVRGDWIKPGAVVIDVGINRIQLGNGKSRLTGDVSFSEAATRARAITPVPGGVGPMTIACLLANTLKAFRRRRQVGLAP